jgi:hypothetical protein
MTDSTARVDVVALGEAMVEFNQAHADDPYNDVDRLLDTHSR